MLVKKHQRKPFYALQGCYVATQSALGKWQVTVPRSCSTLETPASASPFVLVLGSVCDYQHLQSDYYGTDRITSKSEL